MTRAHYFIGKRSYGTSTFHGLRWQPTNYRFICPECGESWAEILVDGGEGEWAWAVKLRHCVNHGQRWGELTGMPSGGISEALTRADSRDTETALAFESLPLLLKNREVLLRILQLERNNA